MTGFREAIRTPIYWIGLAGAAVGACAPALGDLLDGGEDTLTFLDAASGATVVIDADDCEVDEGDRLCPYDATITGAGWYDGDYSLLLSYGAGGEVLLLEAVAEGRNASFEGEMELLPRRLGEGDSERESEGGNVFSLELEEAGGTVDDADGGKWTGCKRYKYLLGATGSEVYASVCAGAGLVKVEAEALGYAFLRTH